MNNQNAAPPTAAEILQNARTLPGQNTDSELSTIFGGPNNPVSPFVNAEEIEEDTPKPSIPMMMETFCETYVIWRPWETCKRCLRAIEQDEDILPHDEGDYTCPHTQLITFKKVKDNCYRGDAVPTREEYNALKNGTQIVTFGWMQPDEEYMKKAAAKKKEQEENQVYPPNPDKVFSKPIEEVKAKGEGDDVSPSPEQKE